MRLLNRFLKHVSKEPSGHWIWTGYVDKKSGRGAFRMGNRLAPTMNSSRAAWTILRGVIPPEKWVLHDCDRSDCVNPAHLYLGDSKDNYEDRRRAGRGLDGDRACFRKCPEKLARGLRNGAHTHPERRPRGEAHGQAKLNPGAVQEILQLSRDGWQQREIAAKFGVHQATVWRVLHRRTWVTKGDESVRPGHARRGV